MKAEKNYNTTEEIWHNVANEENVWIKWRFDTVKLNRIDAQDYDINQTLKKGKSKNDNRS